MSGDLEHISVGGYFESNVDEVVRTRGCSHGSLCGSCVGRCLKRLPNEQLKGSYNCCMSVSHHPDASGRAITNIRYVHVALEVSGHSTV